MPPSFPQELYVAYGGGDDDDYACYATPEAAYDYSADNNSTRDGVEIAIYKLVKVGIGRKSIVFDRDPSAAPARRAIRVKE